MERLKLASLAISLILLIFLFDIYILPLNIINISNKNDIQSLEINQKITFSGKVISEKQYSNSRTIFLDNNLSFRCPCQSYLNKTILVSAVINNFYENKIIKIKKIEVLK